MYASFFDQPTKTLVRIYRDSVTFNNFKTQKKNIQTISGVGEMVASYKPRLLKGELYFFKRGSGQVYRALGDSVIRIDKSFDHKMQQNCAEFIYNDTLYRHGGYGLWSARNFLNYFDLRTREWEVVRPTGSDIFPAGLYKHHLVRKDEKVFVFGGYTVPENDPIGINPFNEVWSYDLKKRRWDLLGKSLGKTFSNNEPLIFDGFERDATLIFFNHEIIVADPEKNEIVRYAHPDPTLHLYTLNYFEPFFYDGKFWFYRFSNHETARNEAFPQHTLEFCSIPETKLFAVVLSKDKLYSPIYNWNLLYFLLGFFTIGYSAFRFQKWSEKRNKIALMEKGIGFKGRSYEMDKPSLSIIRLLLNYDEEVESNKLLDLISNPELDYTQNIRIKNQLIGQINLRLMSITGSKEEIILTSRSSNDKRIKKYKIRKQLFDLQQM